MISFEAGERARAGYLALPERGHGPGVLVLHAWWGLTDVFKETCERLARAGFVAFAPDLFRGAAATTIEQAQNLAEHADYEATQATALAALAFLRQHPAVTGDAAGVVGFSFGAAYALLLSALAPRDVAAVVLFYGSYAIDFGAARAAYLGHFAENDEYEPPEEMSHTEDNIRAAGRDVAFYTYPGTRHWFFEPNRPEYDPAAAALAWDRTLDFLQVRLGGG